MGEERTEGAQRQPEYLTVGQAAKLLGVHRNTIHYRIKTGRIKAHKVRDADREVYRIERNLLSIGRTSTDVHTLDAQRTNAGEALAEMIAVRLDEIVRDYTEQLGNIREQLGAERARREMAEERNAALEAELESLRGVQEPRESPVSAENRADEGRPQETETSTQRRSLWDRLFGW